MGSASFMQSAKLLYVLADSYDKGSWPTAHKIGQEAWRMRGFLFANMRGVFFLEDTTRIEGIRHICTRALLIISSKRALMPYSFFIFAFGNMMQKKYMMQKKNGHQNIFFVIQIFLRRTMRHCAVPSTPVKFLSVIVT